MYFYDFPFKNFFLTPEGQWSSKEKGKNPYQWLDFYLPED